VRYEVRVGKRRLLVETEPGDAPAPRMLVDGRAIAYEVRDIAAGRHWSIQVEGGTHEVAFLGGDPPRMWVDGIEVEAVAADERVSAARARARASPGRHEVRAPMPGLLKAVHVREGEVVERGAALATLEAMKMENELRAPLRTRVQRLAAVAGAKVESGALIAILIDEP